MGFIGFPVIKNLHQWHFSFTSDCVCIPFFKAYPEKVCEVKHNYSHFIDFSRNELWRESKDYGADMTVHVQMFF